MYNRDVIKEAYALDLTRELILNRYLLNTILTNLFLINEQMNQNFAIIGGKKRKEKVQKESSKERNTKRKEKKVVKPLEEIKFEFFSISQGQYQALLAEYPVDVVNEATLLLDGYLRRTKRTVKSPYLKLKTWAIHLAMKKRLTSLTDDVVRITADRIDLENIKTADEAIRYIRKVPSHLRNIDNICRELVEKFNIQGGLDSGNN